MQAFEIYVDDDRYTVPTFYLIHAVDIAAARQVADQMWRESPHHRGVELALEGVRLFGLGSLAGEGGSIEVAAQ